MNKLYFTIGLPRSSKSTLAKKWLNYNNYIEDGKFRDYICTEKDKEDVFCQPLLREKHIEQERRVVVSGDDIRCNLYGALWNPDAEDFVDSIKWIMIKTLLDTGHTVLLDETNTSERSIRKILEIDIEAEPAFVNTSPEICKTRATSPLDKPIDRMEINLVCFVEKFVSTKLPMYDLDWPTTKEVISAVDCMRGDLIDFRKDFTNEPVRTNPKLPEVSSVSKQSNSVESNSRTGDLSPFTEFQVW